MKLAMDAIGRVKSKVVEGRDEGWGEVTSELEIDDRFAAGLRGIEDFSHVVVVFWMHQASFDPATNLVRCPRGRQDMPEVGIFAQRAKHRPNPIGITAVRLVERRGNVLVVRGLDAIDGSPIVDIKPYVAAFDRVENPMAPEWMARLMHDYF
ncbi:MAG TPA: tRNA (N6-threonylcarbamoyladenosine(37)-N6)-methyltransferase TrmO [Candidatus Acidoferrum sp.]|nr:tRNA (N6-threonylcarbamoyladenosine(37)-N6)-methyltransferase TrmO [Candidatus Acidoferrum sp.]